MKRRDLLLAGLALPAAGLSSRFAAAGEPPRRLPPYVLTSPTMVNHMLRIADVGSGDVVYDLGSGDGRIVIEAARRFGTRGVGIDINPQAVVVARENAVKAGVEKLVTFHQGDLFDADVSEATVVMLYLFAEMMLRLRPKLLRELPDGARIVSHDFDFGRAWPPDNQYNFGVDAIYMWRVPPRAQRQI
jgi:SAM-dependent methyltransferase